MPICTRTGNLASYSFRKSKNDALVMLGETGEYEPLSRGAYYKAMLSERVKDIAVDSEEVTTKKKNPNA